MDAIVLSQVLDLINKTGKNSDVAGTLTLFARLAQIAGYTDTLETLLGTANPASGDLTTLFRAAKLLDTKLGTNADAAGTATLFARLAQIAGYTDTLETSLGQTGDAANATGSANAKLAALLQRVGGGSTNATYFTSGSAGFAANSTTTILNISGNGLFCGIYSFLGGSFPLSVLYGTGSGLKIFIDGVLYFDGVAISSNLYTASGLLPQGEGFLLEPKEFNSSLLLQWVNGDTTARAPATGIIINYKTGVA